MSTYLGRVATRRPPLVCLVWLIVILAGFGIGSQVMSRFEGTGLNVVSSESYQAGQYLNQQDPSGDQLTALITGADVTTPAIRAEVLAATAGPRPDAGRAAGRDRRADAARPGHDGAARPRRLVAEGGGRPAARFFQAAGLS